MRGLSSKYQPKNIVGNPKNSTNMDMKSPGNSAVTFEYELTISGSTNIIN